MLKISDLFKRGETYTDKQSSGTPVKLNTQTKLIPAQNTEEHLQEASFSENAEVSRFSTQESIEEYKKETAKKLEDENIDKRTRERVGKFIYIEGRGDDQIDLEALCQYAKSDSDKWDKIEKLIYIEGRGDSQFGAEDIEKLVELPDFLSSCWEKAYSLSYVEDRGNSQFGADEIIQLANLPSFLNSAWSDAQRFTGIAGRGDKQFSADEICTLIKYDYDKVKEMVYIAGRGGKQFSFEDIKFLTNVYPLSDFEKAKKILCLDAAEENQLDADTIRKISYFEDEAFERLLNRNIALTNRSGKTLSSQEMSQLAFMTDDAWINAQCRGLFGEEYDQYSLDQICLFANYNPLTWANIQSRNLIDPVAINSDYSYISDMPKIAGLSEENYDFYNNNRELCKKLSYAQINDENLSKINKAFKERNLTSYDEKLWSTIINFSDEQWDIVLEKGLIDKVASYNLSDFLSLSDEEWENIEERKVFETLCNKELGSTNSEGVTVWGKKTPADYALAYAKFTDEQWSALEKKNVLFNTTYTISALETIALLSDQEWEKLRASRLCFDITPGSISAFLKLSDDDIKKAEQRIGHLDSLEIFLSSGLISLTDKEYEMVKSRDINTLAYSVDQIVFLASLSDESWNSIMPNGMGYINTDWKNRNRIITELTKLPKEQIDRIVKYDLVRALGESNILDIIEISAFSDSQIENFMTRNLFNLVNELEQSKDSGCASCVDDTKAMAYLSKLTDAQWQSVQEEGLLHSSFRAGEIYLLANIDKTVCQEYEEVKEYISILDEASIALLNQGVKLKNLEEIINYNEVSKIKDIPTCITSWKNRGINPYKSLAKMMSQDDKNAEAVKMLVSMVQKGELDKGILSFAFLNASLSEDIIGDVDLMRQAKSNRQNIADLIVPQFQTTQEAAEQRQVGDVFAIEGENYIYIKNDDNSTQQLKISKETYMKLFPPLERFILQQGNVGDCYFVASLDAISSNPYARSIILQCFSEENSNIKVEFPNGTVSYEAPLQEALNLEDSAVLMKGASGFQLLEHLYGLENQESTIKYYSGIYDYTAQLEAVNEEQETLEKSLQGMVQGSPEYDKTVKRLEIINQAEENYSLLLSDGVLNMVEGIEAGKYYDGAEYFVMQYNAKFETTAEELRNQGAFGTGGTFWLFGLETSGILQEEIDFTKMQDSDIKKGIFELGLSYRNYDYSFIPSHAYAASVVSIDENGKVLLRVTNPWNSAFEVIITGEELSKYCSNKRLGFSYAEVPDKGE